MQALPALPSPLVNPASPTAPPLCPAHDALQISAQKRPTHLLGQRWRCPCVHPTRGTDSPKDPAWGGPKAGLVGAGVGCGAPACTAAPLPALGAAPGQRRAAGLGAGRGGTHPMHHPTLPHPPTPLSLPSCPFALPVQHRRRSCETGQRSSHASAAGGATARPQTEGRRVGGGGQASRWRRRRRQQEGPHLQVLPCHRPLHLCLCLRRCLRQRVRARAGGQPPPLEHR